MNKYLIIFLFVVIAVNVVFAQPACDQDQKDQQQPLLAYEDKEEEEEEQQPEVPAAPVAAQPIAQNQNARVEEDQPIPQREGWWSWLFGYCSIL